MRKLLRDLFRIEKKPRKNLFAMEWVVMAYLLFTTRKGGCCHPPFDISLAEFAAAAANAIQACPNQSGTDLF